MESTRPQQPHTPLVPLNRTRHETFCFTYPGSPWPAASFSFPSFLSFFWGRTQLACAFSRAADRTGDHSLSSPEEGARACSSGAGGGPAARCAEPAAGRNLRLSRRPFCQSPLLENGTGCPLSAIVFSSCAGDSKQRRSVLSLVTAPLFFFVRVCAGRERVEISSVLYSRFFKRSRNLQQSEHYFFVQEERTDDRLTLTGGGRLYVILNGNM